MAQKKKSPAKKQPPPKKGAAAKPRAIVGATSGVGVNATWISVFERNEQGDGPDNRSDEQISAFMIAEFPTLEASLFKHVNIMRGKYNRGGLSRKDKSGKLVRPKIHSKQYAQDGRAAVGGKQQPTRGGVPGRSATSTHKKDFKSHKK